MKKLLSISLLLATMGLFLTGCLKDKGFENHEYGINDPDTQPPGVGFPLAAKGKNAVGLDIVTTTQVIDDLVYVNLNSGSPAPADIQITLTNVTTTAIPAYNTANGTTIEILDPSLYTVATTLTIPAGQRNVQVPLNILSTQTLDPNKSYGIALTITSVSGNYKIASNMQTLIIEITIKNKYDGVYLLTGYHNRPPATTYGYPYETEMHMVTSGPASVIFFWPEVGGVGHPIGVGPGVLSWYGATIAPNVTFDPVTNLVINVNNTDPGGPVINKYAGPDLRPNFWDPVTRNIIVDWMYSGNNQRAFFDNLEYIEPR